MENEAKPILDLFNFKFYQESTLFTFYISMIEDFIVTLSLPKKCDLYKLDNIGGEIAATMTHQTIEKFHPDLILNLGSAGGISYPDKPILPGDIVYCDK